MDTVIRQQGNLVPIDGMVESPDDQLKGSAEKVQCVLRLIARTMELCMFIWLMISEYAFLVKGSWSSDDICDAKMRLIVEESSLARSVEMPGCLEAGNSYTLVSIICHPSMA